MQDEINIELIESIGDAYKIIIRRNDSCTCIETTIRKDALFALIAVAENTQVKANEQTPA